jgi:hypothetical protein
MTVWLEWRPDILEQRRTRGVWISTGESMITPEEFDRPLLSERIAVLREHRPGYRSTLVPASASPTRKRQPCGH